MSIVTTEKIVSKLRAKNMIILVDAANRENEGDLLLAAEFVTPEAINFMITYARGLVCLTLTEEHCKRLNLKMMHKRNGGSLFDTNFTASIEAARGVTTGISAADRAHTIQVAVKNTTIASDLVQPGHVFPLRAKRGGVLVRPGHTEAGCDLMRIAGLIPAAVICEILKDNGAMARLPDLMTFSKIHKIEIGTIADLVCYRSQHETIVKRVSECMLHTTYGTFKVIIYRDVPSGKRHLALVYGYINPYKEILVHVHSFLSVKIESVFFNLWKITSIIAMMQAEKSGVVILLHCQEKSVEKVFSHLMSLNNTSATTTSFVNFTDMHMYGVSMQILKDLHVRKIKLLANRLNTALINRFGLEVTGYYINSQVFVRQ